MARNNKLSFTELLKAHKKVDRVVPKLLGERARRFFEISFKREGFNDRGFNKWAKRKNEYPADKKRGTPSSYGKKTLSNTGALANSIRVTKANSRKIQISSIGLKYANKHNSGNNGMPKRQFMGNSEVLEKGIAKKLEYEYYKAMKL